jgi:hypothetical protein
VPKQRHVVTPFRKRVTVDERNAAPFNCKPYAGLVHRFIEFRGLGSSQSLAFGNFHDSFRSKIVSLQKGEGLKLPWYDLLSGARVIKKVCLRMATISSRQVDHSLSQPSSYSMNMDLCGIHQSSASALQLSWSYSKFCNVGVFTR